VAAKRPRVGLECWNGCAYGNGCGWDTVMPLAPALRLRLDNWPMERVASHAWAHSVAGRNERSKVLRYAHEKGWSRARIVPRWLSS
jgi:hypothetical protein